jgi:hypothetical protein
MTTPRRTRPCWSIGLTSVLPGVAVCKMPSRVSRGADLQRNRSTSLRQPATSIAAVHERCLTSAPPRLSCTHLRFQYRHRSRDGCVHRSGSLCSRCCANGLSASGKVAVRCLLDRNRWRHTGERRRACTRNLASSSSNGWIRALASGGDRFVPRAGRLAQLGAPIHPEARLVYPGKQGVW